MQHPGWASTDPDGDGRFARARGALRIGVVPRASPHELASPQLSAASRLPYKTRQGEDLRRGVGARGVRVGLVMAAEVAELDVGCESRDMDRKGSAWTD